MFIYADVLIITNIYVDFMIIESVRIFTHSPLRTSRGIIAAVFGSLFSLLIFLPKISFFVMAGVKIISSALIVYAAFGFESKQKFIKQLFIFYLSAFIFGGIGTLISNLSGGKMILSRNGVIYADFSLPSLVITTIAAYVCISLYKRLTDCSDKLGEFTLIISDCGKAVSMKALADTGNILKDSFTGKPVIICPSRLLTAVYNDIPELQAVTAGTVEGTSHRWRIIPFMTASGSSLTAITLPKEICIKNDETGRISSVDAYIGISADVKDFAIFHPKIL